MKIQFCGEQLRAFEQLSHDRNPLHNDPVYARSTQFGRPVVYGMCGVLLGLGHWAGGRAFRLTKLLGRFTRPLFESVEYDLEICGEGSEVTIRYLEGDNAQMSFRFSWVALENPDGPNNPVPAASSFRPGAVATDAGLTDVLARWQKLNHPYSIRSESLGELLPNFCLQAGQLPLNQLNALMGSSYLVGMEVPGRQALFSSFEFQFDAVSVDSGPATFQFEDVSAGLDRRFNRVSVSGRGSGMRSFSLLAFQRPKPVQYAIEDIRRAGTGSKAHENQVVFISGATRGFGAVLARMLALEGARVLVNYRSRREAAEAVATEVRPWNTEVYPVAGDVSRGEDCRLIREEVGSRFGRVDLLISNAFPQIPARGFLEQSSGEFMKFLEESVSATATLFRELLPLVPKDGMVLLVSTRFAREPEPQYSHYIAAKSCVEGLMRSLAVEFPEQMFVIVRPPRMLTDQTNLVFDLSPPVSALAVAGELMARLQVLESSPNLVELDLGKNQAAS